MTYESYYKAYLEICQAVLIVNWLGASGEGGEGERIEHVCVVFLTTGVVNLIKSMRKARKQLQGIVIERVYL